MSDAPTKQEKRLAVVLSHPTQYFSPWFQYITAHTDIKLKVFYLWDFGIENRLDRNFGHALKWDIPLLQDYEFEFITNISTDPGTHHFFGLNNPGLVGAMRMWNPDAILMFGYNFLSHIKVLLSWSLRKIPILQRGDSHDLARAPGLKSKINRFLRSILFKRFAAFLSVGKSNADYLRNSAVPDGRIHFVPHCIDNKRFLSAHESAELEASAFREELSIASDARVILFAGKFENKKRPLDLLVAFQQLPKNWRSPVLLFVGAGQLEAELKKLAGLDIGKTIFFSPFQNQTQMPKVYALSTVLVLPSFGDGETWGLAINEVMNLGRPAIVSSHVGCGPDLIENEVTGWIFPAGNIDELATILQRVVEMSSAELGKMGDAALKRVQCYSYQHASKALVEILDSVLQRKISGK